MDFSNYGLQRLSQSFPQFKMGYIFLELFFFQNISQMMLQNIYNISVKKETAKISTMETTDFHIQIAQNLIFYISYSSSNVKMFLQITNLCYQHHLSVYINF